MTVIIFFMAALLGGIMILAFIQSRLERIREEVFNQVCVHLERVYRQTVEDIEDLNLDTVSARRLFEERAGQVVDTYWLQVYGGKEMLLHWEYATFRQIIGRFRKLIGRRCVATR